MTFNEMVRTILDRGDYEAMFTTVYALYYKKDPTATLFDDRWGRLLIRCNGINTIKDLAKFVVQHNIGDRTVYTRHLRKLEDYQMVVNVEINPRYKYRAEVNVSFLGA